MYDIALASALAGHRFELSLSDRSGKVQNFYAMYDDIVGALQEAMQDFADDTHELAIELCPVDTGFMRDHLVITISPERQVFEIGWRASDFFDAGLAFYPQYVVLGTRFIAPNDPLTPAHEQAKPRYEGRARELVNQALERRKVA